MSICQRLERALFEWTDPDLPGPQRRYLKDTVWLSFWKALGRRPIVDVELPP